MFSKTAIFAAIVGLVAAQAPTEPSGNPITRPLNEIVPACKPFTITWQPTTPNSVTLIFLKGPSTNVVPFGPNDGKIVEGIPNSGEYVWTPPATADATEGPTGYGIKLVDDVTGQFQYSTQFGISKGPECDSYVEPSPSSSQYGGGYPVSTPASSKVPEASSSAPAMSSYPAVKPSMTMSMHTSVVMPSGTGVHMNSTIVMPTGTMSVPSSLKPTMTPTGSAPPEQTTNAAAGLQAGLGMVGAAAVAAFML